METKEIAKEIIIIILAAIILGFTVSFSLFLDLSITSFMLLIVVISFIVIISLNIIAKKLLAYYFEANVKTRFWSWYQYWFSKGSHFKKPVPMLWLPLVLSIITKGLFWWLAVLEFDVEARVERVSRRHGLYRFTEMTDWHIALIATAGIITNLVLAVIGYMLGSIGYASGFELFARLNIYFAAWSIIPLSNLDGSKVFFGSKILWFTMLVIISIFVGWTLMIV